MCKQQTTVFAAVALALLSCGQWAQAGEVGNALTPRAAAADGAPEVFYSNFFSAPYSGTINSMQINYQGDNQSFNFYQLRPTGVTNQYTVVYNSGTMLPAGGTGSPVRNLVFPNGPTNVQPGDFFAHFGRGIPFSDAGTLNANQLQSIYYPSNTGMAGMPAGTVITLGSTDFPLNNGFIRDYASAVNLPNVLEQVGFGTTDHSAVDTGSGIVGILRNDPFTKGGEVDKWHIFSNSSATNRSITPLLLRPNGGNYTVIGVGTARVNSNTGLQMFDFGLVSGTDIVLPGDVAGWWDGSGTTANAGVLEFATTGTPTLALWTDANGILAGDTFTAGTSIGTNFNRQYSINFSTATPEPASVAAWGVLGLIGLGVFVARRRRASA